MYSMSKNRQATTARQAWGVIDRNNDDRVMQIRTPSPT
jgi:hypothetical protein